MRHDRPGGLGEGGITTRRLVPVFARAMRWCVACCALSMVLYANAAPAQQPQVTRPGTPGGDIPRLRTETSRTFIGPEGSYKTSIYAEPVNYRDDDGEWQLIDNELKSDGTVLRNRAGEYRLELPKDISAGDVRVAHDGAWISFAPRGATALARARDAAARYRGAWPGVELRYKAGGDGVKEELVLSGPVAVRDFVFDLRLRFGLTPVVRDTGVIEIRDDATGDVPLQLQPSFMVDAAGATEPVTTRLAPTARGWTLVLAPDRRWLRDSARRWPVTIDPQVSTGGTEGCEISIEESGCWLGTGLAIGYREFNNQARTLLRFDVANALPAGAVVEHADLYVNHEDANIDTFEAMEAHEVTNAWGEPDWENTGIGPWGTPGGDFAAESLATFDTGETGLRGWDITDLTRDWSDYQNANYGVILKVPDPMPYYSATTIVGVGETNGPRLEIQYAQTDDPDGVTQQAAVEFLMDEDSLTEAEALRRLVIQDRVNTLSDALEAAVPAAAYAGLWFGDDGNAKIGIEATGSTPPASATEDAADLLAEHDLTDDVDFVAVESSLADLESPEAELSADVASLLDDGKVTVDISQQDNALAVERVANLTAGETTTLDDAVDEAENDVDVDVDTVSVDSFQGENDANSCATVLSNWLGCDSPFRGGARIDDTSINCTGGVMSNGRTSGALYLLTAGHCLSNEKYPYTKHTANFRAYTKNGVAMVIGKPHTGLQFANPVVIDAGIITVNPASSGQPSPLWTGGRWVFVGTSDDTTRDEWYEITHVKGAAEKSVYCMTSAIEFTNGKRTSCGKVKNNNTETTVTEDPNVLRVGLASIDMCGPRKGSSGGPVYKNHVIVGIHVIASVEGCRKYFTRIGVAQNWMNVDVLP